MSELVKPSDNIDGRTNAKSARECSKENIACNFNEHKNCCQMTREYANVQDVAASLPSIRGLLKRMEKILLSGNQQGKNKYDRTLVTRDSITAVEHLDYQNGLRRQKTFSRIYNQLGYSDKSDKPLFRSR